MTSSTASRMTAIAVSGLLIDCAWKRVSTDAPHATTVQMRPRSYTAALIAGTRDSDIRTTRSLTATGRSATDTARPQPVRRDLAREIDHAGLRSARPPGTAWLIAVVYASPIGSYEWGQPRTGARAISQANARTADR